MSNTNEQNIDFYKKFQEIKYDMSKASLEDVKSILDHYNQGAIEVNGLNYHYNINPLAAASLNARYKQLTGQDHPTFISEQGKVLDEMIQSGEGISVNGDPTVYEQLKSNNMEIVNHNHILNRTSEIILNPQEASLEDISLLLNYYNGNPVLIDGVTHHLFNDPISAAKLNARYKELTGQNHPVFTEQVSKVIDGLMKDKDMLVSAGAYDSSYFDKLEQIKSEIQQASERKNTEETKRAFTEERDKQRQFDASVRKQQIDAMMQTNQNLQDMQQMISEATQDNSIEGMSR